MTNNDELIGGSDQVKSTGADFVYEPFAPNFPINPVDVPAHHRATLGGFCGEYLV
ncbi:MAG: hypothetical protein ACU0BB_06795 [Paracoccaceae bacterium]